MPAAGVPERTPVAAVKVTPLGKVPVSDSVGAGEPVAVTVKLPALPTVNVAELALVIAGALKCVYDVLLLSQFRSVAPSDEPVSQTEDPISSLR